jgi:hypothetical protein
MQFTYDLSGDIASWTYPAGFTIANGFDNAGRITQISSGVNDGRRPPSG